MPLKHDHPKYGPALLELLAQRWPDFNPLREMEKMYHDAQTPPKLKKRLQKDLAAYGRVVAQDPKPRD
jgi:hypothetical protein